MKRWLVWLVILIVIVIAGIWLYRYFAIPIPKTSGISNFEECAQAGNPIMESYPRRCTAEGITFTEKIGNELEKSDVILVDNPRPNTKIESPLTISGQARGLWYFEAQFPVRLYNESGELLTEGVATAEGEWMTEEFVPFSATLTFETSSTDKGELILIKANPSGLPENADELLIPVIFNN
jgi:hypothetical protein